jgi:hypothetical protein
MTIRLKFTPGLCDACHGDVWNRRDCPKSRTGGERELMIKKVTGLMPTWQDMKQSIWPILRGTALGSFLGILPGGGATLSSGASLRRCGSAISF